MAHQLTWAVHHQVLFIYLCIEFTFILFLLSGISTNLICASLGPSSSFLFQLPMKILLDNPLLNWNIYMVDSFTGVHNSSR